ncbi:MAG TPA: PDZ domain-containing protein [Pseudonocardiaceae bacterium]
MLLIAIFGVLGGIGTVPYVALGPGPTYDTLGSVDDDVVVTIAGADTYPTGGRLNMTTVSVASELTLFSALGKWVSGRYALVPREEIYPPDRTTDEVQQEQARAFQDSEAFAETAALTYLKYPTQVIVNRVTEDSPSAGKLEPGDLLLTVNGRAVTAADQVRDALTGTRPGQVIDVRYQRGPTTATASVTLGAREDRDTGFLGVEPANQPDVPFDITISLADVGGPSAGLMFALAIVDKLTPGELNGGQFVAGTGEITSDGQVGPIGGIPFKMTAAREAGATVFLVPADNCLEAAQRAPDGLRLVKVETLSGAVDALEALRTGGPVPPCS